MSDLAWRLRRRILGPGLARDVRGARHVRRALLLYSVAAFRAPRDTHQNVAQSRGLAGLLDALGYRVDVADWNERRARALRNVRYDLVVDLHPRERPLYADHLAEGAVCLGYFTGQNPAVSNRAELGRLDDLFRRRGIRLAPRRQVPPFSAHALESLAGAMLVGGVSTRATFDEFRLARVWPLVNSGYDVAPTDPARRDPRRFLFLAGAGMVHKGLDLLLEAVAADPALELVICAPLGRERDFAAAYRRELSLPNVRTVGFVDVRSEGFRDLQASCGALVMPSCAEGQCGSITVALSYGLPCLASAACGFDEPELRDLDDRSVERLRGRLQDHAGSPRARVVEAARRAHELARARYTLEHYLDRARDALRAALGREAVA